MVAVDYNQELFFKIDKIHFDRNVLRINFVNANRRLNILVNLNLS